MPGTRREERGGWFSGHRVSVSEDGKVLEMGGGDGCIAL